MPRSKNSHPTNASLATCSTNSVWHESPLKGIFEQSLIASFNKMVIIKDTHREKTPSNKIPVLTKSTNIGIWVFGTSNQLFIGGS